MRWQIQDLHSDIDVLRTQLLVPQFLMVSVMENDSGMLPSLFSFFCFSSLLSFMLR